MSNKPHIKQKYGHHHEKDHKQCISCNKFVNNIKKEFRNIAHRIEFLQTGLCQKCQDEEYGV